MLYGRFHDGRDLFAAGDFDETDGTVHHQPEVQASGECICLAYVGGKMVFDGVRRTHARRLSWACEAALQSPSCAPCPALMAERAWDARRCRPRARDGGEAKVPQPRSAKVTDHGQPISVAWLVRS